MTKIRIYDATFAPGHIRNAGGDNTVEVGGSTASSPVLNQAQAVNRNMGSVATPNIPPAVTSAAPANVNTNTAYSHQFTASGTGPLHWSVLSGVLPIGLTLDDAGLLSGTTGPLPSSYGFTVQVLGPGGTATQACTIVAANAPTITSGAMPSGIAGQAYSHQLTATGSAPLTWSILSGALPAGLSLNSSTGLISGTPTATGSFSGTIQVSNIRGTNTQAFSFSVASSNQRYFRIYAIGGTYTSGYQHVFILKEAMLKDTVGGTNRALNRPVAVNGTPDVTYVAANLTNGNLSDYAQQSASNTYKYYQIDLGASPAWDIAEAVLYQLAGNNNQYRAFKIFSSDDLTTWKLRADVSGLAWNQASNTISITPVNSAPVTALPSGVPPAQPFITSSAPANVNVSTAYSHTFTATGAATITWSVTSGSIPAGLSLNTSTGVLSGTTTATAASYSFTVTATNAEGTDSQAVTIIVATAPTITSAAPVAGTVNSAYSHQLTASGSTPITWSVVSGSLPAGLSLNTSTGLISGTPTAAGTATGTIRASNIRGTSDQAFSIAVAGASIAARYWRFEAQGYCKMYEVQLKLSDGTNVALASAGSSATVSDVYGGTPSSANQASNLIDGDITGGGDGVKWASETTGDHWCEIDLGQVRSIASIVVYPRSYNDGFTGYTNDANGLVIRAGNTPNPTTYSKTALAGVDFTSGTTSGITVSAASLVALANLTPTDHSSATVAGQGTVSTSVSYGGGYTAVEAMDSSKAVDGGSYWYAGSTAPSVGTPIWLKYVFASAQVARRFTWVEYLSGGATSDVRDFQIQGSNDGSNWTTLKTVSTKKFFVSAVVDFANNNAYTQYRILVTANAGSNGCAFRDFRIWG